MSKFPPLVSVITGYHNRKENLLLSVQSVLDQDYSNFEYIVFDDCSTDGTYELLQGFERDPRLKLIRHEINMGLTKGLIHAIAESKGEYIAIHGAGDISFKERIRKQVSLLENNPHIGVAGCLIEDVYDGESHLFSPEGKRGIHYFSHGEVMYRRRVYFKAGGYNSLFKYGQFTMLKFEMLKFSDAGFVNEILYKRIHYSNGVTRNRQKRLEQIISIRLGTLASSQGFWNVDTSSLIIALSFQNIDLVLDGSADESRLLHHIEGNLIYKFIFFLYKKHIIPKLFVVKTGSYIRKRKKII